MDTMPEGPNAPASNTDNRTLVEKLPGDFRALAQAARTVSAVLNNEAGCNGLAVAFDKAAMLLEQAIAGDAAQTATGPLQAGIAQSSYVAARFPTGALPGTEPAYTNGEMGG